MENHKKLFYQKLDEYYGLRKDAKKPWNYQEINEVATDILLAKETQGKKTRRQYHLLSLYDTIEIANDKHAVIKKRTEDKEYIIYVAPYEDIFQILHTTHITVGHGCRDKMIYNLKTKYQIPRPAIEKFLESCEICQKKKNRKLSKLISKPIISRDFHSRGQIDVIDYETCQDGEYKWLLNYQDHLTKFTCLRPLKSQQPDVIALELLKIFLELGAPPAILQSDNGREFVNSIISELVKLWPDLKIIHARHTQSQNSLETSNQDIENMLQAWMQDNNSANWSVGCFFVQFQKNCLYHRVIGRTPYNALFGTDPKIDQLSKNITHDLVDSIQTEDDFNNLQSTFQVDKVTVKNSA